MALTTNKTILINGNSKDGENILANFNATISENGQLTLNETIMDKNSIDAVDVDYTAFKALVKSTLEGSEVNG